MNTQAQDDLDVQLLEPLLRHFVSLIGLQKTMLIVERWGGQHLYIAEVPKPDGDMASLIGLQAAQDLAAEFGSERPSIPKAGKALRAFRDAQIRAEHSVKSIRQLVLDYKLSERRICEILAAGEPDMGSLFP